MYITYMYFYVAIDFYVFVIYILFLLAKGAKIEPTSISMSRTQPCLYKGTHSLVLACNLFLVQDVNPSVRNIHTKQQPNPLVVTRRNLVFFSLPKFIRFLIKYDKID